ncbi:hypothetical protein BV25DRAFT_1830969 [Artomyces pyxidatus]|uniref:Uncharacterized protein n=1 Tax=Artomyces pyxidatus TaxID=48021 RepID=A0ACB8SP99_9AGAM|nr:hypothetical protein BV25DRAFT_1830969 [Artomyces pyxidatus]
MPPNEYAYLDWFQGGLKHLGHEGERCARCLRHAVQFHGRVGTECSNCLPAQIILKRCTACKFVAYCSKECQRAHWSQHGGYCRRMSKGLNKMDILSKRLIWVVAWCKEHLPCLQAAARSLMRAASLDPAGRSHNKTHREKLTFRRALRVHRRPEHRCLVRRHGGTWDRESR